MFNRYYYLTSVEQFCFIWRRGTLLNGTDNKHLQMRLHCRIDVILFVPAKRRGSSNDQFE
jgi:hypothetical protein